MKNLATALLLTGALLAGCGGKDDPPHRPGPERYRGNFQGAGGDRPREIGPLRM